MADGSDPTPLARAIACIPTGLYVVTTLADGKPVGFVASFLMQVGFSPPTLCVAVAKERGPLAPMRASGRFTVSVLDEAPSGLPVLSRALSWLDCRASGEHETGDHVVLFGTVEHGGLLREGDPAIHLRKNGLDY
jgi:3-hydroxy-9,10-secoandrosta-1,3,5(10)-triene-9,17-dione monooxygenase reductase component